MSVYFYSFIYFWSLGNITDITSRALKLNFLVFFLDHVISLSHSHEKFLPCGTPYVQTIIYSQLLETIVTIRYPDVFMFCAVRFFYICDVMWKLYHRERNCYIYTTINSNHFQYTGNNCTYLFEWFASECHGNVYMLLHM